LDNKVIDITDARL